MSSSYFKAYQAMQKALIRFNKADIINISDNNYWENMMVCDYIKVLNYAEEGEWDTAHQLIQSHSDKTSCLIHAYLHRVEGDLSNANYWYARAESKVLDNTLEEELNRLYLLVKTESD